MAREQQIRKALCEHIAQGTYTERELEFASQGFVNGAKWADSNPIISKKLLEELIEGIKSGKVKTLSEYSNSKDICKIFDDGQISAIELLLTWINHNT